MPLYRFNKTDDIVKMSNGLQTISQVSNLKGNDVRMCVVFELRELNKVITRKYISL